jgi:hypothetical protein
MSDRERVSSAPVRVRPSAAPPRRIVVRRPPAAVVLLAVVLIALGETSGAVIGTFRAPVAAYASARIAANASAHGLSGSAEYDDEIRARAIFSAEAGLSFLHTHAEGLGLIVLFVSTIVATAVGSRRIRGVLHGLVAVGGLFPLGYLVYAAGVLELGRDAGIELAERWILTPLGSATIVALVVLAASLVAARSRRGADLE